MTKDATQFITPLTLQTLTRHPVTVDMFAEGEREWRPTHIAVALCYDRKTMQAPRLVAKGIRKNAEQIREIARQCGVPLVENKPLARLMFKYGKVGREIPAQLYAAVAEVLAHVYRTNPYRYYAEACTLAATETR